MLSLLLSTVAFFVVAFLLNRYFDGQGLPGGLTRRVLVGTLATVVASGTGWAVDKLDRSGVQPGSGPSAAAQGSDPPTEVLKAVGEFR